MRRNAYLGAAQLHDAMIHKVGIQATAEVVEERSDGLKSLFLL